MTHLRFHGIGATIGMEYDHNAGRASPMNRIMMKRRAYGYARVNQAGVDRLREQTEPITRYIGQLNDYEHDPAADLVVEVASGNGDISPKLARLLARMRPGDLLVVTHLDRLGRVRSRVLNIEERCRDAGAELVILDGVQVDPALAGLMEQASVTFASAGWKDGVRRSRSRR